MVQVLIAAVGISLALMPLLAIVEERLNHWLERLTVRNGSSVIEAVEKARGHTIVIGQSEVGRIVTRMLKAHDIPYISLDNSAGRVKALRKDGEPIYYGDATEHEILHGLRADRARAIVVTTSSPGTSEAIAAICRHSFPDVAIIVRGSSEETVSALRQAGVTLIVHEATETGLRLAGEVLHLQPENPASLP
jgi:CPA2 family monovalent cation:H+ antiporter-2